MGRGSEILHVYMSCIHTFNPNSNGKVEAQKISHSRAKNDGGSISVVHVNRFNFITPSAINFTTMY